MKARLQPSLAMLLLVAGCGEAERGPASAEVNETVPAVNETAAAPKDEPASDNRQDAAATANAAAVAASIPPAFHGVYDRDAEACATAGSEYRLRVAADALRFHESIGEVRAVRSEGGDAILVDADFEGEGESWSGRLRLSRGAGGALTVTQPDGSRMTRTRC